MTTTIADILERTRADQGLPPKVEDPCALANVATLLLSSSQEDRHVA